MTGYGAGLFVESRMNKIQTPKGIDYIALFATGAIWGSAFLCVTIALRDFPPISIAAFRITLAALALYLVMVGRGLSLPRSLNDWLLLMLIGALNSSIPFSLISYGQQSISSGTSAMLISTAPFSALVIAHFFTPDDRLSFSKFVGMSLGFMGILVLVGADVLASNDNAVSGQLMVLLAAFCYGSSAILIRKITHINPLVSTTSVLLITALYFFPLALWLEQPLSQLPSNSTITALIYLAIMPTALAYLIRFWLVARTGTVFFAQVAYLIPVFALLWGWMFLSEFPDSKTWMALGLILAGIAVDSRSRRTIGK